MVNLWFIKSSIFDPKGSVLVQWMLLDEYFAVLLLPMDRLKRWGPSERMRDYSWYLQMANKNKSVLESTVIGQENT